MKTHTSRWVEVELNRLWELRERAQDGGRVLGEVKELYHHFYVWTAADTGGWSHSRYAAQRAVRKALRKLAAAGGAAAHRGSAL